jgi:hypothetical protein
MPVVTEVECKEGEECVSLRLNDAGGTTLALHKGFEERHPERVGEFLIAQQFVQARLGVFRQIRWIRAGRTITGFVVGAAAILLAGRTLEPLWLAVVVAMGASYLLATSINLLVSAVWLRMMIRRSDRALAELLGKAQVVEALEWYAGCPGPPVLRYLWKGAPPTVGERLRWLGDKA